MKKTNADSSAKEHTKTKKTATKTTAKAAAKPDRIPRGMTRSDDGGEPFSIFVSDLDQYLFGHGVHYDIYKKLGAHEAEMDGRDGVYFAGRPV